MSQQESKLKCDMCGTDQDVYKTVDPIALELHDEQHPMTLCSECAAELAEEI